MDNSTTLLKGWQTIKMNKLTIIINGIRFLLIVDNKKLFMEQEKVLSQYVLPSAEPTSETITIYYTKNSDLFNSTDISLTKQELETLDTYKNEKHFKGTYQKYTAFQKDNKEYYVLSSPKSLNEFTLIGNPHIDTSIFPIRLMREILIRKMEEKGIIFSHATGVTVNNEGMLLINNSGGGKTTLMTKFFESNENVGLLSNDRVFATANENTYSMNYFPFPILYSMGTVRGNENIKNYFIKTKQVEKATNGKSTLKTYNKKIEIPLTDMKNIYPSISLLTKSKIGRVIIPKLQLSNKDKKFVCISKLEPSEAYDILSQNTFTPNDTEVQRKPWLYPRKLSNLELSNLANKTNKFLLKKSITLLEYGPDASSKEIISKL